MKAYKFLRNGAISPFAGVAWKAGEVVEAEGALEPCRRGVHACRPNRLAYWISDELWTVDLDGEIVEDELKLVARRGRLLERIGAWDHGARDEFGRRCALAAVGHAADELREAGLAEPAERLSTAPLQEIPAVATDAANTAYEAGMIEAARLAEYAADAAGGVGLAPVTLIAYIAAHAADSRSTLSGDPFADERERQSLWLAYRLGLSAGAA